MEKNSSQIKPNFNKEVGYFEYRKVLDLSAESCRKQGLITEDSYYQALGDPRTIIIENDSNVKIPVLCPISLVPGLNYNFFDRNYSDNCFLISTAGLNEEETASFFRHLEHTDLAKKSFFYEHSKDNCSNDIFIDNLIQSLNNSGIQYSINDFLDYSTENEPEYLKTGSMILYSGNIRLKAKNKNQAKLTDDLCESFSLGVANGDIVLDRQNGSELISGAELKTDEKKLRKMWQVYEQRLSEIATNYPINLEDTFEDFVDMVTDDNTVVSIAYDQGEVACFTYLLRNIHKANWLNVNYTEIFTDPCYSLYYFPGIVAHKDRSGKAIEVLHALAKSCKQNNIEFDILFECTNHSAAYIPQIIAKAADMTGYINASTTLEEQIFYKILKIGN